MPLHAWAALNDCKVAARMLDRVEDEKEFRVLFVAACALLRAVGAVLRKVDRRQHQYTGAIDQAWKSWRDDREEHAIFWDFIESERNLLLKEYHISVDYKDQYLAVIDVNGDIVDEMPRAIGPELYAPLKGGRYDGEDVRDLVHTAVEWWVLRLREIEAPN